MSIWGKIIGSAAGMALGGPLGGLIGLVVGAAVDANVMTPFASAESRRRVTFTIGVIALSAKMAKADGKVTRAEVEAFKQVFRVESGEMRNVGRVFDLARQHTAGYQAYARQIAELLQGERAILTDLLDALFFIALADGEIHPAEKSFLEDVTNIFGFSSAEFYTIYARYETSNALDANNPYYVLGVETTISDTQLKAQYRKRVSETHPDRLIAEGVPPELIAVATRRTAEVNAAYDQILEMRRSQRDGQMDQ